jgi:branched-chain amino acid transport system substrate-binding protein
MFKIRTVPNTVFRRQHARWLDNCRLGANSGCLPTLQVDAARLIAHLPRKLIGWRERPQREETMLKSWARAAALSAILIVSIGVAAAEDTVKMGIVGPMTGPNAVMGDNWRQGIEAYLALHGDTIGGRKIELVYRDTGGDPSKAKQLVQELVVRDKISFVGGFGLSPEASAAAPVINQAKIPAFLFHTASPALMNQSAYFVRMGQNIATCAEVASTWALRQNKKTAYIAVADYAPGVAVLEAFKKHFTTHGGKIVGEDKMALNTVDFSAFAERIAAAKPDLVEIFIPPGSPAVGFVKALAARGVMKDSIVIGQGEAEDPDLHLFDDSVKGFHSAIYYSSTSDTPENKAFKDALKQKFGPGALPSTFTLGAYDAMGLVFKMLESEAGQDLVSAKRWN